MATYNKNIVDNICIFSYNSRGFNLEKQKFCRYLLNTNQDALSILCNQENFVLKSNGYIIRKSLPEFHVIFKPASKEQLEGRPKNGIFIAVSKIFKKNVKDVSPNHPRIQAIILNTGNKKLMIINTYFPQDPKTIEYHPDADLRGRFCCHWKFDRHASF